MEFCEVIEKRRSTRAFLAKDIEEEKIKKILQAANLAPSAHNLQSYKIYLTKRRNLKIQLARACFDQEYIAEAPLVLVFVSSPEKTGNRSDFYSLQDATIACYQSWLAAVDLGLSAVWIGAFDPQKIACILHLEHWQQPVVVLPVGYADETPPKTRRKSLTDLVINI